MPSHQLAATLLATAVWAIFAAGMVHWTPPPAGGGTQIAAAADGPAYRAAVRTASRLEVHR